MTLAVNDRVISQVADGVQTVFFYDFPVAAAEELLVYVSGAVYPSNNYIVDLIAQTVTMNTVLLAGVPVDIVGDTPSRQIVKYSRASNSYQLSALEEQLDDMTKVNQEQRQKLANIALTENAVTQALEASVAAIAAAAQAVQAATDAIAVNPQLGVQFSSRASAIAATINAGVLYVRTAGYLTPGDGGDDFFKWVAVQPTHAGKFQSANGRWFEKINRAEVDVKQFGAKCDGVTDDYTAWQAALDCLPSQGGDVWFDGHSVISQSLVIGNGVSGAVPSSRNGAGIRGRGGKAVYPLEGVFVFGPLTKLTWIGAANQPIIYVLGPYRGFRFDNFMLEGQGGLLADAAGYGIRNLAGAFGEINFVTFSRFRIRALSHEARASGGAETAVAFVLHRNLYFIMPELANATGIALDGAGAGATVGNVNFCTFENVRMVFSSNFASIGVYARLADTCTFDGLLALSGVAGPSHVGVYLDYSGDPGFPYAFNFRQLDVGFNIPVNQQILDTGVSTGAFGRHQIDSVPQGNGGLWPRDLANTQKALPQTLGPDLVQTNKDGTVVFSQTLCRVDYYGKHDVCQFRVNYNLILRTVGTAGTLQLTLGWTDEISSKGFNAAAMSVTAAGGHVNGSIPITMKRLVPPAFNALGVSVTPTGATGAPKYDLYITVERLM